MQGSDKEIMEILEAFGLTRCAHSAGGPADCDPKTVARCVARRDTGAVYLAAARATGADIARLRELVSQMDAATSWPAFRAVDPRFHLAVAAIAGSEGAVRELVEVFARLLRYYVPYPIAYLKASNREHELLVDAIAAGDGAGAAAMSERHISALRRSVFVNPGSRLVPHPRLTLEATPDQSGSRRPRTGGERARP